MDAGSTRSRRPALRRILVALASVLLGVALLEGCALLYFAWTRGGLYYSAEIPAPPRDPAEGEARTRVFHPYFGFVPRPGEPVFGVWRRLGGAGAPADHDWAERRSNNFGFFADSDYPVRDDEAWLVGVFGGSLAHSFALQSGALLEERLGALAPLEGRRVRVLNFASGGYKQPQQLLILAYFLSIGQRLDLVVNLDGFNEASLGSLNFASGFDTSMPTFSALRALAVLASAGDDPQAMRFLVELDELRARRAELERERAEAPLALLYVIADLRLRRVEARRRELARRPPGEPARSLLWLASPFADPSGAAGDSVEEKIALEWRRASVLMAALARESGARYLHVLQPNQHAGAHVFSEAERRIAFGDGSPYAAHARALYPLLRATGSELGKSGIDFRDATALFDDVTQSVYADDCCHLNQRGYDLLAEFVAVRVGELLAAAEAPAAGDAQARALGAGSAGR